MNILPFFRYTKKQINLRSALTVIACLSCDRLRMRLGYMFHLNCPNNELGLTKECFRNFLRDLSLLLSFLSEKSIFESSSIDNVIDNCFQNVIIKLHFYLKNNVYYKNI